MHAFAWTSAREQAALLLAEGGHTEAEIATETGIPGRTLRRLKSHADFLARVAQHKTAQTQAAIQCGIAQREARVAALDDRWQRMQRVIAERAADPEMAGKPGGATGLLVRTFKGLGRGDSFVIVEELGVDTGLLAELRAHEKQAAQELGQWTEKAEISGSQEPIRFTIQIDRRDGDATHDAGEA